MAKTEDFSFDDDDFSFDLDDLNEGGFKPKKGQSATRKAITDFGGSFISGIKSSLLNPSNQRRFIEKNLPDGFTAAFDAISTGNRAVKDIYRESKEEFKKGLGDVSHDIEAINSKYGKSLPKGIRERLEREVEDSRSRRTYAQPTEEQELATSLDDILKNLVDGQNKSTILSKYYQHENTGKIIATQATTTTAISVSNKILSYLAGNTDKLVGIGIAQSKIQRKNTEIAYKQVVIQRQLLDTTQKMLALQTQAFADIIKNTGLPEAVKSRVWEDTTRAFKNKMVGRGIERVTARAGDLFSEIVNRVRDNSRQGAFGAGGGISGILQGLSMYAQMGDMMGSRSSQAGEMAGGAAGNILSWLVGKKYGDKLRNNKTLNTYSNAIQNAITSAPGTFNKLQNSWGPFSVIASMLGIGDIRAQDTGVNVKVRGSAFRHMDEVVSYNKKSDLAVTEVIPGWLSKMEHHLRVMVTGDTNQEQLQYNWEKGGYITNSQLKKETLDTVFNKSAVKDARAEANKVINTLDPNKELVKKDRELLMRYVLKQANSSTGFVDPRALMTLNDTPIKDPKAAERIAEVVASSMGAQVIGRDVNTRERDIMFGNMNTNSTYQAKMRQANQHLQSTRDRLPNGLGRVMDLANTGNIETLIEAGLVKWDGGSKEWKFDQDAYIDRISKPGRGNGGVPPNNPPRPGGSPRGPFSPPGTGPTGGVPPSSGGGSSGQRDAYIDNPQSAFQMELIEAIQAASSRNEVDISNQLLETIRQRLDQGIPTGGAPVPDTEQRTRGNYFKRLMSFGNKTRKGLQNAFTSRLKNGLSIIKSPFSMVGRVASGAFGLLSGSPKIIGSATSKFSKMMGDVYVKGKEEAVIKLADLKAGKYYDKATNKLIKTLKDIKGAVVDKEGNTIISEEDYSNGLYTIAKGKAFSIVGGVLRAGLSVFSGVRSAERKLAGAIFSGVGGGAKAAFKTLGNLMKSTPDIYVAGETTPRLLGRIMRNGGYRTKDGDIIKNINDIIGDVYDASGDVVMSVADISRGLVDKSGKPFRTLMQKVGNILTLPLRAVRGIGRAARRTLGAVTSPFAKMGNSVLSKMFGSSDQSAGVSGEAVVRSADTLEKIYALLDSRIKRPKGSWTDRDGSGFRDGSREDVLSRTKKEEKEVAVTEDASKDRKGIIGMLMALVGGIGGVIGTIRSWAGNIFNLIKLGARTKLLGSALNAVTAVAGLRRGRGLSRAGGLLTKAKTFAKSGMGKGLAAAAIGGGIMAFSQSGFAQQATQGASKALFGADDAAFKANYIEGGDGNESSSETTEKDKSKLSLSERITNGIGGSVLGEIGAIASFPLLAAAYNKLQGTKLGKKIMPTMQHGAGATKAPTTKMGKAWQWATGTNKGRIALATATGAGLVGGQNMLFGTGGESLAESTAASYRNTLLLELGMVTAAPWAIGKGKQWLDRRRALKGPQYSPAVTNPTNRLAPPSSVLNAANRVGVAPVQPAVVSNAANRLAAPGAASAKPITAINGIVPGSTAVPAAAAGKGIGSKVLGAGKSIFRHAGILGTGLALADAATTDGTLWDKTKAFGGSLLTTAAIGKGLSVGGKLFSAAGREGLKAGAKNAAGWVARQGIMQGARTAAVAGLSGLAGAISAPVLLGGLAVVAAGAAGYFAYKRFFTSDKNALIRVRLAQYGIRLKDKDKAARIAQLEALASKHVNISGASANFAKSLPESELINIFGLSKENKEHLDRFLFWFENRFKPVYLTTMAAYQALTKKKNLEAADTMSKENKLNFLGQIATMPQNPYGVMASPFADETKLKFDADAVRYEISRAKHFINNEKGKSDKSMSEKVSDGWEGFKDTMSKVGNNVKDFSSSVAEKTKSSLETAKFQASRFVEANKRMLDRAKDGDVRGMVNEAKSNWDSFKTGVSNVFAKLTGSQKERQMMVYKAFKNAGFSEQQSRILTAEIGRENSYNPKYLFGGHADPHKGTNLGMLSWQGSRTPRLVEFLRRAGVLDKSGNIIPSQEALDAQAKFILWELQNTHKKVGREFLSKPNISYKEGAYLIGKRYILWRIDDPKYGPQGIKNRDGFYNTLLKQLNAKDGDVKGSGPAISSSTPATDGSGLKTKTPSNGMGSVSTAKEYIRNNAFKTPNYTNSAMGANGSGVGASSGVGGGYGGSSAVQQGVGTTANAAAFIKSLNPTLIALGKKHTSLQTKSVDLSGMVQGFMTIFYAMIGEAVQRGVINNVQINSAYRSIDSQRKLYNAYLQNPKRIHWLLNREVQTTTLVLR
jgi:hypothetical protein